MIRLLAYARARLAEPSTWTAIGSGLAALGFNTASPEWQTVCALGTALALMLGAFIPESKPEDAA